MADTSPKPEVDDIHESDSSSDSSLPSEEWQDLSKSDFAKVIFCDLSYNPQNRSVGCKFQITDNVHEDPGDYVGLFKIGNQTQCIVGKMLSETECEEDGKLLRCNFSNEDLPLGLPDGFYHFQYVTRDGEVCGASTPIEVKQAKESSACKLEEERPTKKYHFVDDSSDEDVVTESGENDFVLVEHMLEKKNRMLEDLLEKFRAKNLALSSDMEVLLEAKSKLCQEKEEIIENLHQEILSLKTEFARKESIVSEKDNKVKYLTLQVQSCEITIQKCREDLDTMAKLLEKSEQEKLGLHNEVRLLKEVIKDKDSLIPEQRNLMEQLEDQKFMIRALEDSKHLALQEMSDLSESLSKRTKVLNQTRCELASCKTKLKDSVSAGEEKDKVISNLEERLERYRLIVDEEQLATAIEVPPRKPLTEEEIKHRSVEELYSDAIFRAESFLVLIDAIIANTDFSQYSQEQMFHKLKIMFFVMLGKMKKPKDAPSSREGYLENVPRLLPFGQTPMQNSEVNSPTVATAATPKDILSQTEIKKCEECRDIFRYEKRGYLGHEKFKSNCERIATLLDSGMDMLSSEHRTLFNNLWKSYNARTKCIRENGILNFDVNDPISILLPASTRNQERTILILGRVYDAIVFQLGRDNAPLKESFLQVLKESISIELLLQCEKEEHEQATSAQREELEKKIEKLEEEAGKLKKEIGFLTIEKTDLTKKLEASNSTAVELEEEISKKNEKTIILKSEKIMLLKSAEILQETVREHAARISEAAELYKKQYVEIEKLKKKLRHRSRASWPKTVGYESSSNCDEPSKSSEKAPPTKRARKTTTKASSTKKPEKETTPKAAEKQQPEMLKVILKSFAKEAGIRPAEYKKIASKPPAKVVELFAECCAINKECRPLTGAKKLARSDPWCGTEKEMVFHNLREFTHSSAGRVPRKATIPKCIKTPATRCVHSDSDTGEHVLKNTSAPLTTEAKKLKDQLSEDFITQKLSSVILSEKASEEERIQSNHSACIQEAKPLEEQTSAACSKPYEDLHDEKPTVSPIIQYFKSLDENKSVPKVDPSGEPGNRDLVSVHKLLKQKVTSVLDSAQSKDAKYDIPCVLCDKILVVTEDLANLMDHLESDHQISMCPVCGQLFESSFPKKYFMHHVDDHFKTEK